jgi:hypothetical protein
MYKNKAMKLVNALRSGRYKQGRFRLANDKNEFCCLGVACDISNTSLKWEKDLDGIWAVGGSTHSLPDAIIQEYGFYSSVGELRNGRRQFTVNGISYKSLSGANDHGVSFEDIADYIEQNWKYL